MIHKKGKIRNILISDKLRRELFCYMEQASVTEEKVFPHNFRHLFVHCFYEIGNDLAKLADVLGHGSIETTRIYIRTTCEEHLKELEQLELVC